MMQKSYITETNDLFFIIDDDNMMKVYMLDLDKSNMNEADCKKDVSGKIHIGEPILYYR